MTKRGDERGRSRRRFDCGLNQIMLEQPELAIVSMQAMWALSVSAHQRANLVDVGSAEMLVQVGQRPATVPRA